MRKIACEAFINAWNKTCIKSTCVNTAMRIGLEPVDREAPKQSIYVRNLSEREKAMYDDRMRRRTGQLDINNCVITNDDKIAEIRATVEKCSRDKKL